MKRSKETRIKYLELNKVKIAEQKKLYYDLNAEKFKNLSKNWQANNKVKIRAYTNNKKKIDPFFKLKHNLKNTILNAFKRKGLIKSGKTETILGCNYMEFKTYIESKFEPWMNWQNKGLYNGTFNYGWDIDHVIPLSTGKSEEDLIKLNHYTNLQPLCSKINRDIKRG